MRYIIFICTFDIFKGKRHKYTFRNLCEEDKSIKLKDGTTKMFLSTKGEKDDVSKALKNFLDYVDGHAPADELMKEIDTEVMTAKSCDEWRREYMTLELEIKRREKLAAAEAEARGLARGLAKGEAKGKVEGKVEVAIDMLKEKLSVDMISRLTKLTVEQITEIGKKNALL